MKLRVVIVGGGIAGLTTAIAFEKMGFGVELFEAAPKLEPVGAGIWMAPNAMQVFAQLGIAGEIQKAGRSLSSVKVCDKSLRPIQVTDLSPFASRNRRPK